MNLNLIKEIIDSAYISSDLREHLILQEIAKDSDAIPTILEILNSERESSKELISDMNLELSRAHIFIETRKETKKEAKDQFNKEYEIGEIRKFYTKYKDRIVHCFNRFN